MKKIISIQALFWLVLCAMMAQDISVDVNLNLKHTLGDVSTFQREKFVTVHATIDDRDFDGDNFTPNLRDHFLNGYDVYTGRNTGTVTWNINNNITQDPSRPGFANPSSITYYGNNTKTAYAAKTGIHPYEHRENRILCAQLHPFWPDGQLTKKGWAFSQTDTEEEPFGTATGEYMGRFLKDFYGTGGKTGIKQPTLVEVINEPLWHLVDYGTTPPEKVFRFHNAVSDQIKKYVSTAQVGGFCTAFPDLEKNNFNQWEERWKLFMDIAGEKSDFWTIHLYDFPSIGGKQMYRKGSNMEATFDMMEQYSFMKFGRVKPFMISEFGAQMHDYNKVWSPYRDWLHIKSSNAMMMQFMERANNINMTINFLPIKAEWGRNAETGAVYNHRIMRKENEPESYTGQWVYTDMVKIYQLWSDVKGTRVDSKANNLDIMTDCYVNGNKAYVVLNNLKFQQVQVNLNVNGSEDNGITQFKKKHLYLNGEKPVINESESTEHPRSVNLGAEGTMVLEYTFEKDVEINDTYQETKYYADDYYKAITSNKKNTFKFKNITLAANGEAVLRIGVGRDHGRSLSPEVLFNGVILEVPEDYRGDEQVQRDTWFGVLELEVPYEIVKKENVVTVKFPDSGGFISSMTMQVFNSSAALTRSWNGAAVSGIVLHPESKQIQIGTSAQLVHEVLPHFAGNNDVVWESTAPNVAKVDSTGLVSALGLGDALIIVSTTEGGFKDTCKVSTSTEPVIIPTEMLKLSPSEHIMHLNESLLVDVEIEPYEASDQMLTWTSSHPEIASVDESGMIHSQSYGNTLVRVTTLDGVMDSIIISIVPENTQPIPWIEEFNLPNDTKLDEGRTSWTLESADVGPGPLAGVSASAFVIRSAECTMTTGTIYIGGADAVDLEMDVTADFRARNSDHDSLKIYYILDGKEYLAGEFSEKQKTTTLKINGIKGTNLIIKIFGKTPYPDELYMIDNIRVTESVTSGLTDVAEKSNVRLYPNPSRGEINISGLENGNYQVKVYDLQGKAVLEEMRKVISSRLQMEIYSLDKGLYFLRAVGDRKSYSLKFIRE